MGSRSTTDVHRFPDAVFLRIRPDLERAAPGGAGMGTDTTRDRSARSQFRLGVVEFRSYLRQSGPKPTHSGSRHQAPGIGKQVSRSGPSRFRSGPGEAGLERVVPRPVHFVPIPGSGWPGPNQRTPARIPCLRSRNACIPVRKSSSSDRGGCNLDQDVPVEVWTAGIPTWNVRD